MKKILIGLILLISFMARADIDEGVMKSTEPKVEEIASARSCFKEVENMGCGHPRDDLEQFRSCMENTISSLTPACQKMMGDLYIKKK